MAYKWVDFDEWVALKNFEGNLTIDGILISHVKDEVTGEWVEIRKPAYIVTSNNK